MKTVPITEASRRGISGLVADAEKDKEIALSRHGRVVAEIVSAQEMEQLRKDREALYEATLVMTRFMTDSGERTDLDVVLQNFGLSRTDLEEELEAELADKSPNP